MNPNKKVFNTFIHFPIVILMTLTLFGLVVGYLIQTLGKYDQKDVENYSHLIQGDAVSEQAYVFQQHREGLYKDLYFFDKGERRQLHLYSQNSDLDLEKYGSKLEIVEKMHDVQCRFQESLFYLLPDGQEATLQPDGRLLILDSDPLEMKSWRIIGDPGVVPVQQVLVLKANEATYFYKDSLLTTDHVHVSRYVLKGHRLEDTQENPIRVLSKGIAHHIELFMGADGLNFNAVNFKIKFGI